MTDFQCRFIRQEPLEPVTAFKLARCKTEAVCQQRIGAENMTLFVAPQQRQRQVTDDGIAALGMGLEGFKIAIQQKNGTDPQCNECGTHRNDRQALFRLQGDAGQQCGRQYRKRRFHTMQASLGPRSICPMR